MVITCGSGKKWKDDRKLRDRPVVEAILKIAHTHAGYGYRRMTHAPRRVGVLANHKRVLRIMRENKLLVKKKTYRVITTDSEHENPVYPNLIPG